MSKDYNHEIGYETLQQDFKVYKKQAPRGVTLVKGGNNIYLQFKTPNKTRSKYQCNCGFSIDGMINAVQKAHKVKKKLEALTSEVEFWDWYDKEIKNESQLIDDQMTFGEAVKKIEDDFWNRPSRTKRKRDKSSPSDQSSWDRTYGTFYKHLPKYSRVNIKDILKVVDIQKKGTRNYKYVVSAMKKLVRIIKRQDLLDILDELNVTQTENADLQTITLEDFLKWRDGVLGKNKSLPKGASMSSRKSWAWTFSVQVVYGLSICQIIKFQFGWMR